MSARSVWIPPGEWVDAWDGSRVVGPATRVVRQPFERIPLWHRAGGFVIVSQEESSSNGLRQRVMAGDWSDLAIEAFAGSACAAAPLRTSRQVVDRDYVGRTEVTLLQKPSGGCDADVTVRIGGGAPRKWTVRLHLGAAQRAADVSVDGRAAASMHSAPECDASRFQPFGGRGSAGAPNSGGVVEIELDPSSAQQEVRLTLVAASRS